MERLDKPKSKNYSPLVIWAADLNEILSELKNCSNPKLIADDVKYDSVDEFVKESRGRNPVTVKVTADAPYLTVELYQSWARLYVSSSELVPSGLFLKIDAILSRCERKPKFFYRYLWVLISTWVFPNIFYYFPPLKPYGYLAIWIAALSFSWMLYFGYIHLWRFSIVCPFHREDRPSFFRRNVDAIVIAVISAVLGVVGGAAATKVADKIWPNSPKTSVAKDALQAVQPPTERPSP